MDNKPNFLRKKILSTAAGIAALISVEKGLAQNNNKDINPIIKPMEITQKNNGADQNQTVEYSSKTSTDEITNNSKEIKLENILEVIENKIHFKESEKIIIFRKSGKKWVWKGLGENLSEKDISKYQKAKYKIILKNEGQKSDTFYFEKK